MRVTEIEITLGRTILTGQYESARTQISMRAELNEGEDEEACFEELRQKVYHRLQLQVARLLPY